MPTPMNFKPLTEAEILDIEARVQNGEEVPLDVLRQVTRTLAAANAGSRAAAAGKPKPAAKKAGSKPTQAAASMSALSAALGKKEDSS